MVSQLFKNPNHIHVIDSYQDVIAKIKLLNVLPLFCEAHRAENMCVLILEYVKVRFYFESKGWKDLNLSKEKANVKASFKLATTGHLKDVASK